MPILLKLLLLFLVANAGDSTTVYAIVSTAIATITSITDGYGVAGIGVAIVIIHSAPIVLNCCNYHLNWYCFIWSQSLYG